MGKIKNIIFDLGGVLLDLDMKKAQQEFEKLGINNFREMLALGQAPSVVFEHEIGKITDEQFVEELRKLAGKSATAELILSAWNSMLIGFSVETMELLLQLKSKYRLFLFSNTNGIHVKAFNKLYEQAMGKGSLGDHFEKMYYSHVMGRRKPGKEAFEYIINENGLIPSETLFVDDSESNIKGAKDAGLQAFHINKGASIMDLKKLLTSDS
jgi:putative hydrolase of the HAD superfamily